MENTAIPFLHDQRILSCLRCPEVELQIRKCFACQTPIDLDRNLSWELRDFCNDSCLLRFLKCLRTTCSLCLTPLSLEVFGKYHLRFDKCFTLFCSHKCLEQYKSTIKICSCCERVKMAKKVSDWISMQIFSNNETVAIVFCSQDCFKKFSYMMKIHPIDIPDGTKCLICQSEKPVRTIMKYDGVDHFFCSTPCQTAFNFVKLQMGAGECSMCKEYYNKNILANHVVYDKRMKLSFCSVNCQIIYKLLQRKTIECGYCHYKNYQYSMITQYSQKDEYYFCCIHCIRLSKGSTIEDTNSVTTEVITDPLIIPYRSIKRRKIIVQSAKPPEQKNAATMCKVVQLNKEIMTKSKSFNKSTQTECPYNIFIPLPVPIYVPTPLVMYSLPTPAAVPFPLPIPVPVFLPTTRRSVTGIFKELERIRNLIPNDPLEAEILKIAEVIADNDKEPDSESEQEDILDEKADDMDSSTMYHEVLENQIDLEWAVPDRITQIRVPNLENKENEDEPMVDKKTKKKFKKLDETCCDYVEQKEETMRLDYTLGINAWKQWVSKGNLTNKFKFKSEILEMPPEELSYALSLFVKELRKPNGDEYAPDTLYYLCLGIQYYLDINERFENIFFDDIYEYFIICLDELAKKFCAWYDDESHFIVTRVEEEHLWETKQLGCHSPYTLLNTLIYFNTKYFYLATVEDHMELSFFHILKSYRVQNKRTMKANSGGELILRLYPKNQKRIHEQYQNKENPLRCPVKLFEYYLTKCPESAKNLHKGSIYLVPEKHCTCDSPLWYTNQALSQEALTMMLNRVKMVKEVNVALLSQ